MTDRNGWTLWSQSPPPKSEDNLLVVRTTPAHRYEYQCVTWDETFDGFISLHYPSQPFFASDHALWKAVPYPAIALDMAKLVGARHG